MSQLNSGEQSYSIRGGNVMPVCKSVSLYDHTGCLFTIMPVSRSYRCHFMILHGAILWSYTCHFTILQNATLRSYRIPLYDHTWCHFTILQGFTLRSYRVPLYDHKMPLYDTAECHFTIIHGVILRFTGCHFTIIQVSLYNPTWC